MKPDEVEKYQAEVRRLQAIRGGAADDSAGAAAPIAATRLTLSRIVELLLAHRGGREHSSVTLTRNARGEVQIEVVVRTGDDGDIVTVDQAAAKATELFKTLRQTFPLSSGLVGGTGERQV